MKLRMLLRGLGVGLGLLLAMALSLGYVHQISRAQAPVEMSKVLNKDGNVVRVGEVLIFTLALTNTENFTLTSVTLVDEYDETTLRLAGADFPWDSHDPGAGTIIWNNVVTPPIRTPGGLPPGESISFSVVFTAVSPKPAVVNAIRAEALEREGQALTETVETSRTQEAIGGRLPVFKGIWPPGSTPQAGALVTFTHVITNDGAAAVLTLPLTDTYDATFLEFFSAVPTPTTVITTPPVGTLAWANLVDYYGPIAPFSTVVVTTVFTATARVVDTVNEARIEGARDEFNNDLGAWSAQVPITIIDSATPTTPKSPEGGGGDDDDDDDENETGDTSPGAPATTPVIATATPVTASAPVTGTDSAPLHLPETGSGTAVGGLAPLIGALLVLSGWYLKRLKQ